MKNITRIILIFCGASISLLCLAFSSATNGDITLIHAIQGDGLASPLNGEMVTVEAIVVGDYQSGSLKGFFIQEEDADSDGDLTTSEGIFVFGPELININEGDLVRLTGTVSEAFDLTRIENVTKIEILSSGNPLPSAGIVTLPVSSPDYLERFEGMLVETSQELVVTSTVWLGRGGELTLSSGSYLFAPTHVASPGADAIQKHLENQLNQIIIDDASTAQNPDPVIFPAPKLSFTNTIRGGDKVSEIKGILTYSWSGFDLGSTSTKAYRIYPTSNPVFTATNLRSVTPPSVGGSLKVASFNVLNYFNGNGNGEGFPTARGARTYDEFQKQRAKIINALTALDADIIGLMEVENDGDGEISAIQDLVNGLNEAANSTYAFIHTGGETMGSDPISVGMLYNVSTVKAIGTAQLLDASVDSLYNDEENRPALAQSFKDLGSGAVLTVCVNHFKSKGRPCDTLGDPDVGDGQGNCNLTRTKAAKSLVNWLATDPTGSGSPYRLIIGDLNSYTKEDPVLAIKNNGYTDLMGKFGGEPAYSYSYNGLYGYIDHALSSAGLLPFVTGAEAWHLNADEPYIFDYSEKFKSKTQIADYYSPDPYRSSDHDPVIVGIEFE